jgi:hypothetical protein
MTDLTVAKTILAQLGGGRFVAMTGAKNLAGDSNGLSFRLPGAGGFCKNGINAVRITLTPSDLYDVEYMRIRGTKVTVVERVEGIYFDSLTDSFERVTGLATSLGRVR